MQPGKEYIGVGCGALVVNDAQEVWLARRSAGARNEPGSWFQPDSTREFGVTARLAVVFLVSLNLKP